MHQHKLVPSALQSTQNYQYFRNLKKKQQTTTIFNLKIHPHVSLSLNFKRKCKSKHIFRTGFLILNFWFLENLLWSSSKILLGKDKNMTGQWKLQFASLQRAQKQALVLMHSIFPLRPHNSKGFNICVTASWMKWRSPVCFTAAQSYGYLRIWFYLWGQNTQK